VCGCSHPRGLRRLDALVRRPGGQARAGPAEVRALHAQPRRERARSQARSRWWGRERANRRAKGQGRTVAAGVPGRRRCVSQVSPGRGAEAVARPAGRDARPGAQVRTVHAPPRRRPKRRLRK
jgi:hypothetical protein